MSSMKRTLGGLALSLATLGATGGTAEAAAMSFQYSTVGSVGKSDQGASSLVYYNGVNNGAVTPPGSIDLGQFVVSSAPTATNATYTNTPSRSSPRSAATPARRSPACSTAPSGPAAPTRAYGHDHSVASTATTPAVQPEPADEHPAADRPGGPAAPRPAPASAAPRPPPCPSPLGRRVRGRPRRPRRLAPPLRRPLNWPSRAGRPRTLAPRDR